MPGRTFASRHNLLRALEVVDLRYSSVRNLGELAGIWGLGVRLGSLAVEGIASVAVLRTHGSTSRPHRSPLR